MAFNLANLLREAAAAGATDIHLSTGEQPVLRLSGRLMRLDQTALSELDLEEVMLTLAPAEAQQALRKRGEADFSATAGDLRLRCNLFRQRGGLAVAIRLIPARIRSLGELALPEVLADLSRRPSGLILVTGPTGSGKSTTLAAMIDQVNRERPVHIITLEDPIEYIHAPRRAVVHQREVGSDTVSFSRALRAALRQDPDVLLVGEMRDLETMRIALQAAETGHLVLATLHTIDAAQTIDRVVDAFPSEQQAQVRIQLAGTLQGIVAQRLFARAAGPGLVAAAEVLVATTAVRNLIREGKAHQIPSVIQTGARLGMRTLAAAVQELFSRGIISRRDMESVCATVGPDECGIGIMTKAGPGERR